MSTPDILLRIAAARRRRLGSVPPPVLGKSGPLGAGAFTAALGAHTGRAVIAEVKLGSPSLGDLRDRIDPVGQARLYAEHGAAALSVVVEPDFFFGSYELLARCKEASGLPTLAKDFIVHPTQIDEAQRAGADAVLLIAALYGAAELGAWADLVRARGMVPLVETHAREDLARLSGRDWELVGVNNRDLRSFRVDLHHSVAQVSRIPLGALRIAESGIGDRAALERLAAAGFDAFLIGEALLLADDPAARLESFVGA